MSRLLSEVYFDHKNIIYHLFEISQPVDVFVVSVIIVLIHKTVIYRKGWNEDRADIGVFSLCSFIRSPLFYHPSPLHKKNVINVYYIFETIKI